MEEVAGLDGVEETMSTKSGLIANIILWEEETYGSRRRKIYKVCAGEFAGETTKRVCFCTNFVA